MIGLIEVEKSSSNSQIYFTIQIDAKRAVIKDSQGKGKVQNIIDKKIASFAAAVTNNKDTDPIEQGLREYLRDDLFKHYVDIISINDFIYDLKKALRTFKQNIALAGYKTSYKYTNYEGVD